jgi:hypothetical protein
MAWGSDSNHREKYDRVNVLRSASSFWNPRGGKEKKSPKEMAGVAVGQNKQTWLRLSWNPGCDDALVLGQAPFSVFTRP